MVHVNYVLTEMTLKLVYYGPGLCGKTTNLRYIFDHIAPEKRGKMVSLATESDRTLFFDLLPLELGKLHGFKVRLQLFTVPGQVKYNATRKLVLKGVDGLVFVADSQADMLASNVESQNNLRENLQEEHLDLDQLPMVIQYNKRDLPNLLAVEQLEQRLNPRRLSSFAASAITGHNVLETLREISKLTLNHVRHQLEYREEPEELERPAPRVAPIAPPAAPRPPPAKPPPPRPPTAAPPFPRPAVVELQAPVAPEPSPELHELRTLQHQLQQQLTSLQPELPAASQPPPLASDGGADGPAALVAAGLDAVRRDLADLRRDFEGRWNLQGAAHSKLQGELARLAKQTDASPTALSELQAALARLASESQALATRTAELAAAVATVRTEMAQLLQRQTGLEQRLAELSNPPQTSGASPSPGQLALDKRCAHLEAALESMRSELAALRAAEPDLAALEIENEPAKEPSQPSEEEVSSAEVESFWKRLFKESS